MLPPGGYRIPPQHSSESSEGSISQNSDKSSSSHGGESTGRVTQPVLLRLMNSHSTVQGGTQSKPDYEEGASTVAASSHLVHVLDEGSGVCQHWQVPRGSSLHWWASAREQSSLGRDQPRLWNPRRAAIPQRGGAANPLMYPHPDHRLFPPSFTGVASGYSQLEHRNRFVPYLSNSWTLVQPTLAVPGATVLWR